MSQRIYYYIISYTDYSQYIWANIHGMCSYDHETLADCGIYIYIYIYICVCVLSSLSMYIIKGILL